MFRCKSFARQRDVRSLTKGNEENEDEELLQVGLWGVKGDIISIIPDNKYLTTNNSPYPSFSMTLSVICLINISVAGSPAVALGGEPGIWHSQARG